MEYRFLSQKFFYNYPQSKFPELEYKIDRPYTLVCITINKHTFALPLRSHIRHRYAYITDKTNMCGIDFSKAVYISDKQYIDIVKKPHIRQNEFDFLKGKEYIVKNKFINYIKQYVKAQKSLDSNKMKNFTYSTLHYFESVINYERDIIIPTEKKETSTV